MKRIWALSTPRRAELVDLDAPNEHGHYPAIASIWRMGGKGNWWASQWNDVDGIVNLGPSGPKAAQKKLEAILDAPNQWEALRIA